MDLFSQDVLMKDGFFLAGHVNPRNTQIYDRGRFNSRGTRRAGRQG